MDLQPITTVSVTWTSSGSESISVSYTNTNNCTAASPTSKTVTVTPIVGTPTDITIFAGSDPTCQLTNGTTTTTYATTATNSHSFTWSLSNDSAGTIDAATGVMTWANGFNGTVNIQVVANGCGGPSAMVTRTVNITQTAAVASVSGTTPLCIGATDTYTASGVVLGGGAGAWSSSNDLVATVDPSSGLVTAVGHRNLQYHLYNYRRLQWHTFKITGVDGS